MLSKAKLSSDARRFLASGSVRVLAWLGEVDTELVVPHWQRLVTVCIPSTSSSALWDHPQLTLGAISALRTATKSETGTLTSLAAGNALLSTFSTLIITSSIRLHHSEFGPLCQQTMAALYEMSATPSAHGAAILKAVVSHSLTAETESASADVVANMCFVLGETVLRQLVYIDELVRRAEKRQAKKAKEEAAQAQEGAAASGKEAIELELGAASALEATSVERMRTEAEDNLFRQLIEPFAPFLLKIASAPATTCPTIRGAALLALTKFMAAAPGFAQAHMPFILKAMHQDPDLAIRTTLLIAVGDLATKHPLVFDPFTGELFAALADLDTTVRRTALMVISHLVLNDQIKAKSHIARVAFCLEDTDGRTRELAKIFFHEVAQRQKNGVYNMLPDIISRLSSASSPLEPESVRAILNYMLSFLSDVRLLDSLVLKLTARIPHSPPSTATVLVETVTQLNMSARGLRRLLEDPDGWTALSNACLDLKNLAAVIAWITRLQSTSAAHGTGGGRRKAAAVSGDGDDLLGSASGDPAGAGPLAELEAKVRDIVRQQRGDDVAALDWPAMNKALFAAPAPAAVPAPASPAAVVATRPDTDGENQPPAVANKDPGSPAPASKAPSRVATPTAASVDVERSTPSPSPVARGRRSRRTRA
jgi:condensin complex subunit 1